MPTASTGSSMLRRRIEHADFDDVVMQHVLRAVQDIRLQQLDPLVDRHLGDFVGREVGQLDAGLVDRRELLLLQHLVGHVANRDDQVLRRTAAVDHRRGMHAHVAILKTAQRRSARPAGGQRGVERTEVGAEDLGRAHHLVEVGADDVVAAGPLAQPAVAPEDRVVAVKQHDAVGHALQDALVLHEPGDVDDFGEMVGVGVDADVLAAAQLGQRPGRRDFDDLHVVAEPLAQRHLGVMRAAQAENLGSLDAPASADDAPSCPDAIGSYTTHFQLVRLRSSRQPNPRPELPVDDASLPGGISRNSTEL